MAHDHSAPMTMNMSGHGHNHMQHDPSMHNHGTVNHGNMHGMDHSKMDHSTMDHSSMGHGMDHGMKMWFHGGFTDIILFESWQSSSIGGLIGSMIAIMIMSVLYEGLKYYREYLLWKTYNTSQFRSVLLPQNNNIVAEDNGEVVQPTMLSWMHTFQTLLHIIQIVLSYCLMLIFMTYNMWLCLAVALGGAIGYFLFGWKKSVIVDITEHCH